MCIIPKSVRPREIDFMFQVYRIKILKSSKNRSSIIGGILDIINIFKNFTTVSFP